MTTPPAIDGQQLVEQALPAIPLLDMNAMTDELGASLDALWQEVTTSGCFVGGPFVEQFEAAWAAYCERRYAVGVGNGTDALVLALRALGIGPGDEVIVPANTFVATVASVVATGAEPRFVDVDDATLLMTADAVEAACTSRTAAVIAVHLYGQPVDMDAIAALAARWGFAVVEDAAQAHGARWAGRRVGSLSDVACFSFYPGKNLGAFGDAGAVVTEDQQLATLVRSLADHGRPADDKHLHHVAGCNSRLDAIQAGVLLAKLPLLDAWNERRRLVAAAYRDALGDTSLRPLAASPAAESVYHQFVVRTSRRDTLRERLAQQGIATGVHYPVPCHQQLAFAAYAHEPLPVCERAAREIVSLPMYPHLWPDGIERVCDALRRVAVELEREDDGDTSMQPGRGVEVGGG
ncbi:MAG TPA: DegT/DnrJ/EryC1/StrS family aminotransferase [Acidimicrobiales bacterium]